MAKFRELIGGVVFLGVSAFIYALSYQIHMTKADPIGPQFFPRLVALFMAVLSIVSIMRSLLRMREQGNKVRNVPAGAESIKLRYAPNYAFLFTILLLIGYMLLIEKVGFIPLSIVYLYIQIYLVSPREELQRKNLVINGVISVIVPIALYYLFYHAFGIFLPPGILD